MKKILLFSVLLFCLYSCDIGDPATCNSYILGYYSIPEISTTQTEYTSTSGEQYHHLTMGSKEMVILSTVFHDYPEDNGLYDEYCKLHNDTNYRQRLVHSLISSPWTRYSYPASNFTGISLICLNDWDESHPAGSSLGDITTFVGISIEPFIQSGYKMYDYELTEQPELFNAVYPLKKGYGERVYYPITKIVEELSGNDLALLGGGSIYGAFPQICDLFIPKRDKGAPCTIKITMTNTDGTVFSSEVTVQ